VSDQVKAAFEAWAKTQGYEMDSMTYDDGAVEYYSSETWALWGCWKAATASHAAEVEALRSALEDLLDAWDCIADLEGWDKDHIEAAAKARAALKGD
jgi:hypothetical protein